MAEPVGEPGLVDLRYSHSHRALLDIGAIRRIRRLDDPVEIQEEVACDLCSMLVLLEDLDAVGVSPVGSHPTSTDTRLT